MNREQLAIRAIYRALARMNEPQADLKRAIKNQQWPEAIEQLDCLIKLAEEARSRIRERIYASQTEKWIQNVLARNLAAPKQ